MIMKKLSIYYSDDKWYVRDDDWTTKVSWKKENKKKKKSSIKMIKKYAKKQIEIDLQDYARKKNKKKRG